MIESDTSDDGNQNSSDTDQYNHEQYETHEEEEEEEEEEQNNKIDKLCICNNKTSVCNKSCSFSELNEEYNDMPGLVSGVESDYPAKIISDYAEGIELNYEPVLSAVASFGDDIQSLVTEDKTIVE
jgi:hypothetical protein